jgi:hypothetical protein
LNEFIHIIIHQPNNNKNKFSCIKTTVTIYLTHGNNPNITAGEGGHVIFKGKVTPVSLNINNVAAGNTLSAHLDLAVISAIGIEGNPIHVLHVQLPGLPISFSPSFAPNSVITVYAPYVVNVISIEHPSPNTVRYGAVTCNKLSAMLINTSGTLVFSASTYEHAH